MTLSKTNVVERPMWIVHRKLKKKKIFLLFIVSDNIEVSGRILFFFCNGARMWFWEILISWSCVKYREIPVTLQCWYKLQSRAQSVDYNKEKLTAVKVILTGCQNTFSIKFWFLHHTLHSNYCFNLSKC